MPYSSSSPIVTPSPSSFAKHRLTQVQLEMAVKKNGEQEIICLALVGLRWPLFQNKKLS